MSASSLVHDFCKKKSTQTGSAHIWEDEGTAELRTVKLSIYLESEFDAAVAGVLEPATGNDLLPVADEEFEDLRRLLSSGEQTTTVEELFEAPDNMEVDQGDLHQQSKELGAVVQGGEADVDSRPRARRHTDRSVRSQAIRHPELRRITVSRRKRRNLYVGGSSTADAVLEHDDAVVESAPLPSDHPTIEDALPSIQEDVVMEDDVGVATEHVPPGIEDSVRGTDDAHVTGVDDIQLDDGPTPPSHDQGPPSPPPPPPAADDRVPRGLTDPSVLLSFNNHIAHAVWKVGAKTFFRRLSVIVIPTISPDGGATNPDQMRRFVGCHMDLPQRYRASRYRGLIRFMGIYEPYMPDMVVRQFGRRQSRPLDVIEPHIALRPISFKGKQKYFLKFAPMWKWWEQMEDYICPYILDSPVAVPAWDMYDDYLDWFLHISHPYVNPEGRVQPPIEPCPPPLDAHRGIGLAHSYAQTVLDRGDGGEWAFLIRILVREETPYAEPLPRASQ
ncbi:hypothetical protein V2J09_011658 [Rumex salicifolius]